METSITWIVRTGHVLGGAIWVGGYAALVLAVLPLLSKAPTQPLGRVAVSLVRALTYAGTATIFFGIVLITRTRGVENLTSGEWGFLVLASAVIAVILLGVGDGALRPALLQLADGGSARNAWRWSLIGLALTCLAIALMTRAVYAGS